ncbi:MAG: hypothetical protein A2213_06725 [Lysobacterales bacterium RIFOXYA1_FULL_68_6]|nr:MAG: hypothetical protein A2213_06725 [Xanthomonadales bacterium RIFOXYA1_FULL_68_6]
MRFIPTTTSKVESLKKKAKALQRNGGGKHAQLLDRIARSAGYEHWHHVTLCHRETEDVRNERSLVGTIERVLNAEREGQVCMVGTGSETARTQPFLLFSTGLGDAWLLDPMGDRACCLMWRGERQTPEIRDKPDRLEIAWEGSFALQGPFFEVDLDHPLIGRRAIGGYPIDALREQLARMAPIERVEPEVIDRAGAVPLSPETIAQLVRSGWKRQQLEEAARHGALYSPARDSILFPPVSSMVSNR